MAMHSIEPLALSSLPSRVQDLPVRSELPGRHCPGLFQSASPFPPAPVVGAFDQRENILHAEAKLTPLRIHIKRAYLINQSIKKLTNIDDHCGLVVSAPAWDGTGCEFDSWQCRIYIPCSLSLRLLGSLRGSLGTYGLTQKLC